jgi:hypothetical protein
MVEKNISSLSQNWVRELAKTDYETWILPLLDLSNLSPDSPLLRPIQIGEGVKADEMAKVPAVRRASVMPGSRKMSAELIRKLISRFSDEQGSFGISGNCINAMIYLCSICDTTGRIEDFPISSLVGIACDSLRGAYDILHKLEQKNVLSVTCTVKNGLRDIVILDNDFSSKNKRYLNLNRSFFNCYSDDFHKFRDLSLYAKRSLLAILFEYDAQGGRRGYRTSFDKLLKKLGLKTSRLIDSYIKELTPLFQDALTIMEGWKSSLYSYASKKANGHESILALRPHRAGEEKQLIEGAPTCLEYKIRRLLSIYSVNPVSDVTGKPLSPQDMRALIKKVGGLMAWKLLEFKDCPLTLDHALQLLEEYITRSDGLTKTIFENYIIYLDEVVQMSRKLVSSGNVMACS